MKQRFLLLCLVAALALGAVSCASSGNSAQSEAKTVENNRVIGESQGNQKPAASTAKENSPSQSTSSGTAFVPATTTKASLPAFFEVSGSVRDSGEQSIHLRLDWKAVGSGDTVTVQTQLYLECYSLMAGAKSGFITVNGQKLDFRTEAIKQEENSLQSVLLCSESFTLSSDSVLSRGLTVEAQWNFKGTYGDQSIEALCLQDTVEIGKGL